MSNVLSTKDPDIPTRYAIDPRAEIVIPMRRDWPYQVGEIAKAPRHTGYYYECTGAGETRRDWPDAFPRVDEEVLVDGSVEWTARHPNSASLPSITAAAFTVVPSGLSVTLETFAQGVVRFIATSGVDGESYEVTTRVTWSTGQTADVTVVIPVASL